MQHRVGVQRGATEAARRKQQRRELPQHAERRATESLRGPRLRQRRVQLDDDLSHVDDGDRSLKEQPDRSERAEQPRVQAVRKERSGREMVAQVQSQQRAAAVVLAVGALDYLEAAGRCSVLDE